MKIGYLYFHQGWTDIINCLGLIQFYLDNSYGKIYLIIREDAYNIINFYIKQFNNVEPIYVNKNLLDNKNIIQYLNYKNYNLSYEFLFHGMHDIFRKDIYKNKFSNKFYFVESFYKSYNIEYINRINKFTLIRDNKLENDAYENFIRIYGSKYILHHEILECENNKNDNLNIINLNSKTNLFFDYIKILENALELHLIDSIWAAFVYLLDARYSIFSNKKIYVYCKRNHNKMFEHPYRLSNWIFL
jgi:hypothetical protein